MLHNLFVMPAKWSHFVLLKGVLGSWFAIPLSINSKPALPMLTCYSSYSSPANSMCTHVEQKQCQSLTVGAVAYKASCLHTGYVCIPLL